MTPRHSTPTVILAAVLGAAAGVWLSPLRAPQPGDVIALSPSSARAGDDSVAAPASTAATRAPRTAATAPHAVDPQALAQGRLSLDVLQQRARTDPAYLRELLARFGAETELDARGALLAILAGAPNADVLAYARAQLDAADPQSRRAALDLLKLFPMNDASARELVTTQLERESDPAALRQLVEALTPSAVADEDAAPVVARLAELSRHSDADVRAQSVLQYSQWNNGAGTEEMLHGALLDPSLVVRRAAIAGAIASQARSDRLKHALLEIAGNADYGDADRNAALFALQRFSLNRAEHALYAQNVAALDARR